MEETNDVCIFCKIYKINIIGEIKNFLYSCWCGFKEPFVMNIYALRYWKEK